MSRIVIEVTDQQHQSIKALAALQGKSIKEFALQRLFALTAEEEVAVQELKALLTERVARGLEGEVTEQSLDEIVDEVLQSDGTA